MKVLICRKLIPVDLHEAIKITTPDGSEHFTGSCGKNFKTDLCGAYHEKN